MKAKRLELNKRIEQNIYQKTQWVSVGSGIHLRGFNWETLDFYDESEFEMGLDFLMKQLIQPQPTPQPMERAAPTTLEVAHAIGPSRTYAISLAVETTTQGYFYYWYFEPVLFKRGIRHQSESVCMTQVEALREMFEWLIDLLVEILDAER